MRCRRGKETGWGAARKRRRGARTGAGTTCRPLAASRPCPAGRSTHPRRAVADHHSEQGGLLRPVARRLFCNFGRRCCRRRGRLAQAAPPLRQLLPPEGCRPLLGGAARMPRCCCCCWHSWHTPAASGGRRHAAAGAWCSQRRHGCCLPSWRCCCQFDRCMGRGTGQGGG
jgi:hypothetical protein